MRDIILLRTIYFIIFAWLIFRAARLTNDDRKTLLYATTNVLRAPNFSQARRMRKDSTSLSIQRTVRNASTLLQRSSLPLLLVLLANDVHLNPGPFHPRPSEASPLGLIKVYLSKCEKFKGLCST